MPGTQNRKIMRQVIRDGNNGYIRWGLDAVLQWKNDILPNPFSTSTAPATRSSPFDILPPFQNRTPAWSKPNGQTP